MHKFDDTFPYLSNVSIHIFTYTNIKLSIESPSEVRKWFGIESEKESAAVYSCIWHTHTHTRMHN